MLLYDPRQIAKEGEPATYGEVPAVPVGGQLPETPGSDEGGEEGDLTGRRVGPAADRKRGRTPAPPAAPPGVRGGDRESAREANAEVMAVEQVMRWRSEVSRFAPGRAEQPGAGAEGRPVSRPRPRANEISRVESG